MVFVSPHAAIMSSPAAGDEALGAKGATLGKEASRVAAGATPLGTKRSPRAANAQTAGLKRFRPDAFLRTVGTADVPHAFMPDANNI
jgi:hypothetical protein